MIGMAAGMCSRYFGRSLIPSLRSPRCASRTDPRRRSPPSRPRRDRRSRSGVVLCGQRRHSPLVRGHRLPSGPPPHDGRLPRRRRGSTGAPRSALHREGPMYLRLGKKGEPLVHDKIPEFRIGKAIVLRPGTDVCLLSTGNLLPTTLDAADELAKHGVSAEVVSFHTVKPLNERSSVMSSLGSRPSSPSKNTASWEASAEASPNGSPTKGRREAGSVESGRPTHSSTKPASRNTPASRSA